MWQAFVDLIATILEALNSGIASVGIPYSFGFAIILFTVLIKVVTFPLNQKQMESTRATQELQPKLKELQKKYSNDKEKLSKAQMELYKEAGVNPLGGCLPMLVQMPIWFALYRAIYQMASTSASLNERFFWIPSLAGPVTNRSAGLTWLWPFVNGAPPIGWVDAIAYLILPILLVVSQLYTQRMMSPQSNDPNQKAMSQAMMLMPLMFGYFALIVPSGLTLYWFTNNILSMAQQWWINRTMDKKKAARDLAAKNGNGSTVVIDGNITEPEKPSLASGETPVSNTNGADADDSKQVKPDEQYEAKSSRPKSKRKRRK